MYWFNNLLSLATTNTQASESQFLWLILGGLFLVILIAVVIAVAVSSAASSAAIVTEEDSEE